MTETNPAGLIMLAYGDPRLTEAAEGLRGRTVVDLYGYRVGEVDAVVVGGAEREVRALVVSSGGILGLGQSRRLVPHQAVVRVDDVVQVEVSREQVHDADLDLDGDPTRSYEEACAHFGYRPSWPPAEETAGSGRPAGS